MVKIKHVRSNAGYGHQFTLLIKGKHRARWSSRKATTKMPPGIVLGGDENCNRAITFVLWPLGHLDIWWEPNWRTDEDGPCLECRTLEDEAWE